MVKILIMDDEAALRNIVFNMVKPLGHALFTAEDGHQALEVGRREVPDIALLDMRVPDMDGLDVLTELLKINPKIRCIMLSGFGDVDTAVSALKRGAFDYISKPFKIDEVLKVVNKAAESLAQPGSVAAAPVAVPAAVSVVSPAAVAPAKAASAVVPPTVPAAGPSGTKRSGLSKGVLAGGIAVLALVIGITSFLLISHKKSVTVYDVPYANPMGMCLIQKNLWITDWMTGNVYRHTIDGKLSVGAVYKSADTQPTGITFDGEFIWTCSSAERRIYRHRADDLLTVEAIFSVTDSNPSGLYFDGANLWVLDSNAAKIYRHKLDETLSVVGVYDSPALQPCGMFREGEFFFIGDYKTGNIYRVSVKDFTVSEVYKLPFGDKESHKLVGITWDGKNIWALTDGVGKVFQFPLDALEVVKF